MPVLFSSSPAGAQELLEGREDGVQPRLLDREWHRVAHNHNHFDNIHIDNDTCHHDQHE